MTYVNEAPSIKGSMTSESSAISWRPNTQKHDSVKGISYANYNRGQINEKKKKRNPHKPETQANLFGVNFGSVKETHITKFIRQLYLYKKKNGLTALLGNFHTRVKTQSQFFM